MRDGMDGYSYNPAPETFDIRGYRLSASGKFHNIADSGRAALVIDDVPPSTHGGSGA